MERRFIPSLGKAVSLLGFGLMRLPTEAGQSRKVDHARAQALVDRAIAGGVNYFDTAWSYHEGTSETFAGRALSRYPRESYYLADKLPVWLMRGKEDVERVFAEQLSRCNTGYFDFYLLHSLNRDWYAIVEDLGIYDSMRRKKEQGLIRHLGFSFHDNAALMERIVSGHEWDFAQIQLNYVDWEALDAKNLYRILRDRGIPVIIMEPVRGGQLASLSPEALDILGRADPGASAASWALRYAASLPEVMTVLSGMSSMEQVEDNLKTMSPFVPLSEDEYATISAAAQAYLASGAIPCTGCRYCMDCPAGVDIPRVFSIYNHYKVHKLDRAFINHYRSLNDSEQAQACVSCAECLPRCPQRIPIPAYMPEIARVFLELQEKK